MASFDLGKAVFYREFLFCEESRLFFVFPPHEKDDEMNLRQLSSMYAHRSTYITCTHTYIHTYMHEKRGNGVTRKRDAIDSPCYIGM